MLLDVVHSHVSSNADDGIAGAPLSFFSILYRNAVCLLHARRLNMCPVACNCCFQEVLLNSQGPRNTKLLVSSLCAVKQGLHALWAGWEAL